jgi:hypothetical protein
LSRTYIYFREQSNPSVRPFLDDLKTYCLSLGSDVIEEAHTLNVRYKTTSATIHFVDFFAADDSIIATFPIGECIEMYNLICGDDFSESPEPDNLSIHRLEKIIYDRYVANSQNQISSLN